MLFDVFYNNLVYNVFDLSITNESYVDETRV